MCGCRPCNMYAWGGELKAPTMTKSFRNIYESVADSWPLSGVSALILRMPLDAGRTQICEDLVSFEIKRSNSGKKKIHDDENILFIRPFILAFPGQVTPTHSTKIQ
jgi:hypothetical protein